VPLIFRNLPKQFRDSTRYVNPIADFGNISGGRKGTRKVPRNGNILPGIRTINRPSHIRNQKQHVLGLFPHGRLVFQQYNLA
jgi:hypothetical protein